MEAVKGGQRSDMVDAIVIGGGVIGTSVLYYLAKEGVKGILLEKGELADGTSGKCDGNVQRGDTKPGIDFDFVKLGQEMFPKIAEELKIDIQWKKETSLMVFETEQECEAGKAFVKEQQKNGRSIKYLDQREMLECEPNLAKDLHGGCQFENDGRVNPMLLTIGLADGAKRLGASIKEGGRVIGIRYDSLGGVYTVKTETEIYCAPVVINAAGVWAPVIGAFLDIDIPIIPRQGQILVAEAGDLPVSQTVTEFGYLMTKYAKRDYKRNVTPDMEEFGIAMVVEPTEAGNFLVGSSRQFRGYDVKTDAKVIRALARRAMRFFPCIRDINVIRSYAGLRPYTKDQRAILSKTELKGFYVAAGHEGGGITQALVTGRFMSELVLGKSTCIDAAPFSINRF